MRATLPIWSALMLTLLAGTASAGDWSAYETSQEGWSTKHSCIEAKEDVPQKCWTVTRGLRAVPASDACLARGHAHIGAVACERTSHVRVIRTTLEAGIALRLGPNVFLTGKPRLVAKLHRQWPGGGLPVRANSFLVGRGVKTTAPGTAAFLKTAASPRAQASRIAPSSQEIRQRNNLVKYRGVPTRESGKQHEQLIPTALPANNRNSTVEPHPALS